MASKPWSDPSISDATGVNSVDYFLIVQGGVNKRVTQQVLKESLQTVYKTTTNISHTGTNAETQKLSVSTPFAANVPADGNIYMVRVRTRKSGTAGNMTVRVRYGTNNTTADTLAHGVQSASNILYQQFQFLLVCKASTIEVINTGVLTDYSDNTNSGNAVTSITANYASNNFFSVTIQLGNSGDSANISMVCIEKI